MKECAWCGRENADDAVSCRECGTTEFKGDPAKAPATEPKSLPESQSTTYEIPPLAAGQNNPWVTLIRCPTLAEADLVASRLEAAGIATFIPDEFLVQAAPWYAVTTGFTRVQVSPQDYEAARALLTTSQ